MKLAVTDANIFIDLILLEILDYLFALGIEIFTTQEVVDQLSKDQHVELSPFIESNRLKVYCLDSVELKEVLNMEAPRSLEFADRSVAWLSLHLGAMVLTGDSVLRKFCISNKLEVRGIIWFFDQLVSLKIMDSKMAAAKMEALVVINPRLPKDEILSRIKIWKN
jgi:hypothetical protein